MDTVPAAGTEVTERRINGKLRRVVVLGVHPIFPEYVNVARPSRQWPGDFLGQPYSCELADLSHEDFRKGVKA